MAPRARPSVPDLTGAPNSEPADDQGAALTDRELSRLALRRIAADPNAPAAAQAQAARTLLELDGALGRNAPPPRDANAPLAELTRAELEAMLQDPDAA